MRVTLAIAALCLAMPASAQYVVSHSYTLGGEGGWDYVIPDPPHHRLFIARQNRVIVVDERTGKLVGEIAGINGAHGVALVDKRGRGFATSSEDSSIYTFDAKTLKVLAHVHAADDADAIIYDAASDRVFSFNGDAHNATVVNARTGKLVRNVPLGGKPESGVAAGNGKVYVNLTDISEVVEIDAKTLNVSRRWNTAPCKQPVAMAIDVAHARLFSGCRSGVAAVSDIGAGTVVTTLPIGQGVDGAAFDPATGDAFFSTVDGVLTIIHEDTPDTYHVIQSLPTIERGRNMGLDPVTHQVFVVGAKFGPAPAESTAANPRRRPPMIPGSFTLLVIERQPSR
jgi:DNA-binding beta-propeller fold protein YncE